MSSFRETPFSHASFFLILLIVSVVFLHLAPRQEVTKFSLRSPPARFCVATVPPQRPLFTDFLFFFFVSANCYCLLPFAEDLLVDGMLRVCCGLADISVTFPVLHTPPPHLAVWSLFSFPSAQPVFSSLR